MKSKIFSAIAAAVLLFSCLSVFAGCNPPELSPSETDGWSVRFVSPDLGNGLGEIEIPVSEIVENDKVTLSFFYTGNVIDLDAEVLYKGKVQEDVIVLFGIFSGYSRDDGETWEKTSVGENRIPIKEFGRYYYNVNRIAYKKNIVYDNDGLAVYGSIAFDIDIYVI